MSKVENSGDPNSRIWVLVKEPLSTDLEKGYIFSGGAGWVFKKAWQLAGLSAVDPYIHCMEPCPGASYDDAVKLNHLLLELENFQPPIIVVADDWLIQRLCPQTRTKKPTESPFYKWAGSLLSSELLSYSHYIIGTYNPTWVSAHYDYHEIQGFIDLGRVRSEFEYWSTYRILRPLPKRNIIVQPDYDTLMGYLTDKCFDKKRTGASFPYNSHDFETLRPKKTGYYAKYGFPGLPYTLSVAPSKDECIAFCLWHYTSQQAVQLWRLIDALFREVGIIGQNFFEFDLHYAEACGWRPEPSKICDTRIRHHILWPGLEHSLQFLCKQYTREPYYKDEGKHWSPRDLTQLLFYNGKDTTVTFEVFEEQESEFNDRPHLK